MEKAQFKELHVVEKKPIGKDKTRVVKEQKEVEWEVRKFYWNLYKEEKTNIDITEFLEHIAEMKKVSQEDRVKLDEISTG